MPDPQRADETGSLSRVLQDAQGRVISYLRLSVTDRCNYRCVYCSPASAPKKDLSRTELSRLLAAFAGLGVRRVRLTGGEPLWRKDVVELAADAAATPGIEEVCLSTNGTNLAALAKPLHEAGVRKVNVSLDSLDADRFRAITRGGTVTEVTAGIEAALTAGLEVAINAVILRGVNEQDAAPLVRWAWARGATPRFIELMPFAGGTPVPTAEVIARLERDGLDLGAAQPRPRNHGPAVYRRGPGGGEVGFIGALTENFCASCNRLRVSTRGELQACLGGAERVPLAPYLAKEVPAGALEDAIRGALARKEEGHRFLEPRVQGRLLSMMGIGG